jgi:hypothetical protein
MSIRNTTDIPGNEYLYRFATRNPLCWDLPLIPIICREGAHESNHPHFGGR